MPGNNILGQCSFCCDKCSRLLLHVSTVMVVFSGIAICPCTLSNGAIIPLRGQISTSVPINGTFILPRGGVTALGPFAYALKISNGFIATFHNSTSDCSGSVSSTVTSDLFLAAFCNGNTGKWWAAIGDTTSFFSSPMLFLGLGATVNDPALNSNGACIPTPGPPFGSGGSATLSW